jgi:hypothetical protein
LLEQEQLYQSQARSHSKYKSRSPTNKSKKLGFAQRTIEVVERPAEREEKVGKDVAVGA